MRDHHDGRPGFHQIRQQFVVELAPEFRILFGRPFVQQEDRTLFKQTDDKRQAPALTPKLRERMVDGCLREAAGRSVGELERLRDEFLAELLPLVERYSAGGVP